MADRTRNKTSLKRLRNQAVQAQFDGGTLTSDGGLLLLREMDQRLRLIESIDSVIPDPRDLRYIEHQQRRSK
ncbi:MAG: transposase [Planctomycetales bacterium]|nr:transposase [Planctomycetales bacterium]